MVLWRLLSDKRLFCPKMPAGPSINGRYGRIEGFPYSLGVLPGYARRSSVMSEDVLSKQGCVESVRAPIRLPVESATYIPDSRAGHGNSRLGAAGPAAPGGGFRAGLWRGPLLVID